MTIRELMTPDPRTVAPNDTLQQAAQAMDDLNVGVLPVCENGRLLGVLTDRDILARSTSAGQDPRTARVSAVMTTEPFSLRLDASAEDALRTMEERQLRRMMVVDEARALVGVVSLGDLAAAGAPDVADVLEAVSYPAEPDR